MINLGQTLREAREAKGYSVSQLAEITHILPQIIESLEREDFSRIVAPIYGRGFVKLYCEAVGLESQPLVAEFMEIFNGNRPPTIRLKGDDAEAPAPEPPPIAEEPPLPPPIAEEPPAGEEPPAIEDEPALEEPVAPEPPAFNFDPLPEPPPIARAPLSRPAVREPTPFKPGPDDLPFPEDKPEPKRDYRLPGHSIPDVPRSFWRFGILVVAAGVVLALIYFSCRALYRATMRAPEKESPSAEREAPGASKEVAVPKPQTPSARRQAPDTSAPRKPVAIPPLYID